MKLKSRRSRREEWKVLSDTKMRGKTQKSITVAREWHLIFQKHKNDPLINERWKAYLNFASSSAKDCLLTKCLKCSKDKGYFWRGSAIADFGSWHISLAKTSTHPALWTRRKSADVQQIDIRLNNWTKMYNLPRKSWKSYALLGKLHMVLC